MEGVSVLTLNKVSEAETDTSWKKHNEFSGVCDPEQQS